MVTEVRRVDFSIDYYGHEYDISLTLWTDAVVTLCAWPHVWPSYEPSYDDIELTDPLRVSTFSSDLDDVFAAYWDSKDIY